MTQIVSDLNYFFNRFNFFLLTYWSTPFFILRRKNKKLKLKNFVTLASLRKFNSTYVNVNFGNQSDNLLMYNGFFYFQTFNELFACVNFLYNHKIFKSLVWLIGVLGRTEQFSLDFWGLPARCFLQNIECFAKSNGFVFLSNLVVQLMLLPLLTTRLLSFFINVFIINLQVLVYLLNHLIYITNFLDYKKSNV